MELRETRDKLGQAYYALQRMGDTENAKDKFRYNLSDFLTAARSVLDFMSKECKSNMRGKHRSVAGFDQWRGVKVEKLKSSRAGKILFEQRDITVHQRTVPLAVNVKLGITLTLPNPVVSVVVHDKEGREISRSGTGSLIRQQDPPPILEYKYYFEGVENLDVLTICRDYIQELKRLISECETKFD